METDSGSGNRSRRIAMAWWFHAFMFALIIMDSATQILLASPSVPVAGRILSYFIDVFFWVEFAVKVRAFGLLGAGSSFVRFAHLNRPLLPYASVSFDTCACRGYLSTKMSLLPYNGALLRI